MEKVFNQIEEELKIPVQYGSNLDKISAPFIVYLGDGAKQLKADNTVYNTEYNYRLELYFTSKDEDIEKKIEKIFNDNNIPWDKTEDIFISEEKIYQIIYFI